MTQYDAGRELDALVAEKVMGWEQRLSVEDDANDRWVYQTGTKPPYAVARLMDMWHPSTSIADAWLVVEKLGGNFCLNTPLQTSGWQCVIGGPHFADVTASTAPHAICLAALRAVEGTGEQESRP